MDSWKSFVASASGFLHRHVLLLVVASYALAATWPGIGMWIKDTSLLESAVGPVRIHATIPALLLAFLLGSAGMRVRGERMRAMVRRPE